MAYLTLRNVRITGFAAGVPKNIISNIESSGENISDMYEAAEFVAATGVRERRWDNIHTTSDLCYAAAERLISDLNWDKKEIDAIVFVSQTADYILPATSCILQDRLGLSKECYAVDISLGCSGWIYGLSALASLMQTGEIKKALLLVGDARGHVKTDDPLFGYAGTATALEYSSDATDMMFHFGTDGSGKDAIIIPHGGTRHQISPESFNEEYIDGRKYNMLESRMNGMDVFSFAISTAPKSIKRLAEHFGLDYLSYDYYVFHQANKKLNDTIVKKLKLDPDKVPYSLDRFGNTSSASIPMTIVSELKGKVENKPTKFLCCGFGVGLSWGSVAFETTKLIISDIVEL